MSRHHRDNGSRCGIVMEPLVKGLEGLWDRTDPPTAVGGISGGYRARLPYSWRSAAIGSSFAARRAGTKLATVAIIPKRTDAAKRVRGSYGLSPKSRELALLPAASASPVPIR